MRDLKPDLLTVASEVLETAAFLLVEEVPWSGHRAEDAIEATLAFRGAFRGQLSIVAPRAVGALLAANLLGIENDDERAHASALDALGELLNMIAGVLFARTPNKTSFGIGIPRVGNRHQRRERPTSAVSLLVDDRYCLDLEVYVEHPHHASP